jgi:hypothetical protein
MSDALFLGVKHIYASSVHEQLISSRGILFLLVKLPACHAWADRRRTFSQQADSAARVELKGAPKQKLQHLRNL